MKNTLVHTFMFCCLISTSFPARGDVERVSELCIANEYGLVIEREGNECKCAPNASKIKKRESSHRSLTTDVGWVTWIAKTYECIGPARDKGTISIVDQNSSPSSQSNNSKDASLEQDAGQDQINVRSTATRQIVGAAAIAVGIATVAFGIPVFIGGSMIAGTALAFVGVGAVFTGQALFEGSVGAPLRFIDKVGSILSAEELE